ncbi:MAG: multicopper oxidase domain-containing protein [Pirellulales bacterium]
MWEYDRASFSGLTVGDQVLMRNVGPDDFSMQHTGHPANPNTTGQVMQFRVSAPRGPETSTLPARLTNFDRLSEANASTTRYLSLIESIDHHGRPTLLLDGKHFSDPVTEVATLGTTEIWTIENFTTTPHPIHLHATQFQLLDRTHRRTGPIPLEEWELGWEDTIVVNSGERVRAIVPFEQFEGSYVWHCHILEHEDQEMMRPLNIIPEPPTGLLGLIAIATTFSLYHVIRRRKAEFRL